MLRCGGLKVHLVVISGMNPRETINASGLFRKRIVFVRFDLSQPLLKKVITLFQTKIAHKPISEFIRHKRVEVQKT